MCRAGAGVSGGQARVLARRGAAAAAAAAAAARARRPVAPGLTPLARRPPT